MPRVTVRIPDEQFHDVEALVERGVYPNRSEAIRASVRGMLKHQRRIDGRRPREVPAHAD